MVVLSSVAAERARAGNAIYGAAKAGLDALAQGLADATAAAGVRVLVVRPGFVRGRMTAGLSRRRWRLRPTPSRPRPCAPWIGGAHRLGAAVGCGYVFSVLRHLPRSIYRRLPL